MTAIPRERLVATDEIRNDFVSSFKALSHEHVKVELLGGIENTPTITLTAEGYASVQFETDLSVGDEFILYRETEIETSDIYVEGQPLRAASLNAEHSRTAMMLEEMGMRVSDTLHKAEPGDDADLALPSLEIRKNKYLYFDENGDAKVSASSSEWVSELEDLKTELVTAIDESTAQVAALELPLTTDKIADQAITQEKIDPAVRLGGLSAGSDSLIRLNANVIREDVEISAEHNGMSAGPIRIASKNNLYKSEDLADGIWGKSEVSISEVDITKPTELSVVNKVTVSGSATTRHYVDQTYPFTTSIGNIYTMSVYAKKMELDSIRLGLRSNDTHVADQGAFLAYTDFDLANKAVENSLEIQNAGIEDIGDDWCRCWCTTNGTTVNDPLKYTIYVLDLDGNISFQNTDGHSLYLSGAHILEEDQVFPYFRSEGDVTASYSVTVNGVWRIV